MRSLDQTLLSETERQALEELAARLRGILPVSRLVLFGSKVTGTADEESDVDVLVLLDCPVEGSLRDRVIQEVFEINLEYGSNISALTLARPEWDEGPISVLPIHDDVELVGVDL